MASVPTGDASLARLLDPASIAIVGASDNPDKIGGRPIHYMRRHGYAGTLYPVSYTHLDVYKRQPRRCPAPPLSSCRP